MARNVTLALEALGSCGMNVATEQRAALQLSLNMKKQEARLARIAFWGRVFAVNGKDYLLARGSVSHPVLVLPTPGLTFDTKYYFSQDGVKWMDLQPLSDEVYEACKAIRGCFSGEPSFVYSTKAKIPEGEEGGEGGEESGENAEKSKGENGNEQDEVEIRQDNEETNAEKADAPPAEASAAAKPSASSEVQELDRLSALMRQVDYECGVIPKGAYLFNAKKELVKNVHFSGVKFPQELDSYAHFFQKYEKSLLSDDAHGSWSIEVHPFDGVILKSLWWPGYAFYYTTSSKDFGSLYFGMGEKNHDLPFML